MGIEEEQPADIWRVNYRDAVAQQAALGWQGFGYVLVFNSMMFIIAFIIFQRYANSTRFSLYNFQPLAQVWEEHAKKFTLRRWLELLIQTPIQSPEVEKKLGPEGTFYLLYEVYVFRFLGILSIYAMVVLLPLYLAVGRSWIITTNSQDSSSTGGNETLGTSTTAWNEEPLPDDDKWWSFTHATIRSLPNESPFLWIPVATCYFFTIGFFILVRKLSMLSSIPPSKEAVTPQPPRKKSTFFTIVGNPNGETSIITSTKRRKKTLPNLPETSVAAMTPTLGELQPLLQVTTAKHVANDDESEDLNIHIPLPPLSKEEKLKQYRKSHHLIGMQPSSLSSRSLFVDRGVPKNLREARCLFLLQKIFPGYLDDVAIVMNLAEFHQYHAKTIAEENMLARESIIYQRYMESKQQPPTVEDGDIQQIDSADGSEAVEKTEVVKPYKLPWSLRVFPGSMLIPSIYQMFTWDRTPTQEKLEERQSKIAVLESQEIASLEKIFREHRGAGRAFLIFRSARLRSRFVRRVKNRSIASIVARFPEDMWRQYNRYVRELSLTRWHFVQAPEPDDMDWSNIAVPFARRTLTLLIVNVGILGLLLIFTSPVAVTSAISNSTSVSTSAAHRLSEWFTQFRDFVQLFSPSMAKMMVSYIPTLILVMINAVLLNVLQFAGRLQPMATDSGKERLVLRTAAVYLIFNTIFVPSLAFVSIDAVFLYLENNGQVLDMLGTLFLHNSGIFYVNYVLQRCFIGTAVALLRVTEYALFSWQKPRAITPEEQVEAVEAWPFYTGVQFAIQISMLAVIMTFSTVVPLILPVGCLYFVMQHAVDKHSLLHVRPRIKGRGSIARTAVHATCVSILIYQGAMSGFFLVRGTEYQSASMLILLMVTYILTLYWYIQDKERAAAQISKGAPHSAHEGPCHRPDGRDELTGNSVTSSSTNSKRLLGRRSLEMTQHAEMLRKEECELYREPVLRYHVEQNRRFAKERWMMDGQSTVSDDNYIV